MALLQLLLRTRPSPLARQLVAGASQLLPELSSSAAASQSAPAAVASTSSPSSGAFDLPPADGAASCSGLSLLNGQLCSASLLAAAQQQKHQQAREARRSSIYAPGLQEHMGGMLCHKQRQLPRYKPPAKHYEYKWCVRRSLCGALLRDQALPAAQLSRTCVRAAAGLSTGGGSGGWRGARSTAASTTAG
jgi:hypothetical protein